MCITLPHQDLSQTFSAVSTHPGWISSGRSTEDRASIRGGGEEEGGREGVGEVAGLGEVEGERGGGKIGGGDDVEGKERGDPEDVWTSWDRRCVIMNRYFVTDEK